MEDPVQIGKTVFGHQQGDRVMLTFSTPQSMDVVIRQLEMTKQRLDATLNPHASKESLTIHYLDQEVKHLNKILRENNIDLRDKKYEHIDRR